MELSIVETDKCVIYHSNGLWNGNSFEMKSCGKIDVFVNWIDSFNTEKLVYDWKTKFLKATHNLKELVRAAVQVE